MAHYRHRPPQKFTSVISRCSSHHWLWLVNVLFATGCSGSLGLDQDAPGSKDPHSDPSGDLLEAKQVSDPSCEGCDAPNTGTSSNTATDLEPAASNPIDSPNTAADPTEQTPQSNDETQPDDPKQCETGIVASPTSLRRLTPAQFVQTARDLLQEPNAAPELAEAVGPIISSLEVEKLNLAAADLAALFAANPEPWPDLACPIDGDFDDACAKGFVQDFGKLAFRRPLTEDELDWLMTAYQEQQSRDDITPPLSFRESLNLLVEIMLQSPQHVYIQEQGSIEDADSTLPEGILRLTDYEQASRLSYFFWGTMPDAALFDAADAGKLVDVSEIRSQAERLLSDARAQSMIGAFASNWLGLDQTPQRPALEALSKDPERFPQDNDALRRAMRVETEALYQHAFETDNGFESLFLSTQSYADGPLAALYGLDAAPEEDFQWRALPEAQRAGLLTRAAFLTAHANADDPSPIHRGVVLLRNVLCIEVPDPPPDVDNTPPATNPDEGPNTLREVVEVRTESGSCAACHQLINPLGYALGNYDALGQWQTHEPSLDNGDPGPLIDVRVQITNDDINATLEGGMELSRAIADSAAARDCTSKTWFRHAMGRSETAADDCALSDVEARFRDSGNLRELLLDIATSSPALYVQAAPQEEQ